MSTYDAIVLGTGGVGSAALLHLAARGLRVLGLDRFTPGHDRGSSHGQTRMIRQAYFEHPAYVPLVLRAYDLWQDLERRHGQRLYFEVGLLQIGPPDGEVLPGVKRSAELHGLEIDELAGQQAEKRFAGFKVPRDCAAIFERRAGYVLVEACVLAHLDEAAKLGAELHCEETVHSWRTLGDSVEVITDRGRYEAGRLVIAAGAWAGRLLAELAIPLTVLRKPVYWWAATSDVYRPERGCPGFLFETPTGIFYGFPQLDQRGVKVAEHTGGIAVDDPLSVQREIDPEDQQRVRSFALRHLPELSGACVDHSVCMYTMTPDSHFVIDRHPEHPQVMFAAGLSGHGFKFAPVLGEALADMALGTNPQNDLSFLALARPALTLPA